MERYKDFFVPGAIVVVGILVAGAIIYGPVIREGSSSPLSQLGSNNAPQAGVPAEVQVSEQDHVRGNIAAPVTIVEFSDLECPFCKSFHPTVNRALAEYGENVRWVYKHFPLDQLHPKADKEAEAAECAGELGGNDMFWKYVDRVFEITPSNNGLDLALLPQIAQEIGLNRAAFEACLNSGTYADHVEEDYQYGISLGVNGTPGSFVNGVPVSGAVPYETLKAVIDAALAQ
ncbi:MAG: DsbA family protein [Parcubacteria group bacterium]|nr:DsbA family protein [Parcubacteria group bacterium]